MSGFLVTISTTILCPHGGKAQPTPNPSVRVSGVPIAMSGPMPIVGCIPPPIAPAPAAGGGEPARVMAGAAHRFTILPAPGPPGPLCVMANILDPARRVRSHGIPVLLTSNSATAAPSQTPLTIIPSNPRVKGV